MLDDDGLPLDEVGAWTKEKHERLRKYVDITRSVRKKFIERSGSATYICQRLLRESGFTKVEVTGRSGDGGIDGIGVFRIQLVSFHVLFQSKRWKGSVGAGVVRDFRGAMVGRADKGLIITTGTFTADARREPQGQKS